MAVQRGNAAAVLGTSSPTDFDFIQHVAHASVLSFTVLNFIAYIMSTVIMSSCTYYIEAYIYIYIYIYI